MATQVVLAALDTYVWKEDPTEAYGGGNTLTAGKIGVKGAETVKRIIFEFDLTSLVGTTISACNLSYYIFGSALGANDFTLYTLTRDQHEAAPWLEFEATWNNYKASTAWTIAGGDYSTPIDTAFQWGSSSGLYRTYTGPAAFIAMAQNALDNHAGKFAFIIIDDLEAVDGGSGYCDIGSSKYSEFPYLTITYSGTQAGRLLPLFTPSPMPKFEKPRVVAY